MTSIFGEVLAMLVVMLLVAWVAYGIVIMALGWFLLGPAA